MGLADPAQFTPGVHLKAARCRWGVILYAHHGIYEGDGHVIDFGAGSWDRVTRVTLEHFRGQSAAVEVVRHGRATLTTGYLFPAVAPEEIIARAHCLLAQATLPQRYNLIGLNCEHIANWCAAGGYCESHQTRHGFALKAYFSFSFVLYLSGKNRRGIAPSAADTLVGTGSVLLSLLARWIYDREIKRFYEWANPAWQAWLDAGVRNAT